MSRGFLLIDGAHTANRCNNTKPLNVGPLPTQAIYGFLRTLQPMIASFPMLTPMVLWEGRSWRYDVFPEYKASRNKEPKTKTEKQQAALKAQLKTQMPFIKAGLRHLGVRQVMAINYEADDLAGMMVDRAAGKNILLVTGDRDWVQLVRPKVAWMDPIQGLRITPETISDKLGYRRKDGTWVGVKSAKAWLEIKALMGDTSDCIPGVGGIGENGAIDFIHEYGSVANFMNQVIDKTIDVSKLHKKYRLLAEDAEKTFAYQRNMELMNLDVREQKRPEPLGLTVDKGEFNKAAFRKFCEKLAFNSITGRFDEWCEPFATTATAKAAA